MYEVSEAVEITEVTPGQPVWKPLMEKNLNLRTTWVGTLLKFTPEHLIDSLWFCKEISSSTVSTYDFREFRFYLMFASVIKIVSVRKKKS